MSYTQQDLKNIKAAIASGERQVTIGNQSVTYRSIGDLITARDEIQRELNAATPASRPRTSRLYMSGRGYHTGGR